jgi:hypothetical protein
MQLLSKEESKMSEEEKTLLELMRALTVIFHGCPLLSNQYNYDFTEDSVTHMRVSLLSEMFDIQLKDKKLLKNFHPREFTTFPGKNEYESRMSDLRRDIIQGRVQAKNKIYDAKNILENTNSLIQKQEKGNKKPKSKPATSAKPKTKPKSAKPKTNKKNSAKKK